MSWNPFPPVRYSSLLDLGNNTDSASGVSNCVHWEGLFVWFRIFFPQEKLSLSPGIGGHHVGSVFRFANIDQEFTIVKPILLSFMKEQ